MKFWLLAPLLFASGYLLGRWHYRRWWRDRFAALGRKYQLIAERVENKGMRRNGRRPTLKPWQKWLLGPLHWWSPTLTPDFDTFERNLTMSGEPTFEGKRFLIHDRDTKYCKKFRKIFNTHGITTINLPPYSPNLNAFAERWVRSIKSECLERLILFGRPDQSES